MTTNIKRGTYMATKPWFQKKAVTGGALAGLWLLVALSLWPFLHTRLAAWQLLPQPERLTELYVTDPQHIDTKYTPESAQAVAFTVHNLEYRATKYDFTITASGQGQPSVLKHGTVTLAHDQSAALAPTVVLPDLGPQLTITVKVSFDGLERGHNTLTPQNQAIYYRVDKQASVSPVALPEDTNP